MSLVGEERVRLGQERTLIFQNFCNGVSKETLAEEFARSVDGVTRDILFVGKKIGEYRHRRCLQPAGLAEWQQKDAAWRAGGCRGPRPVSPGSVDAERGMLPPIPCATEEDIRFNRAPLLWTLQFIGPETLGTELLLPTLTHHATGNPTVGDLKDCAHAVRAKIMERR